MEDTARELVVATVQQHAESLLRVARRYTDCPADAEDAYQRALEILVKSAHRLDPATVHKWLHTVLKHEAFAVREQRSQLVGVADEEALDALDDGRHVASVEERSERFDELTRAAEALGRCKPQEVTALVLKAQGVGGSPRSDSRSRNVRPFSCSCTSNDSKESRDSGRVPPRPRRSEP